MSNLNCGNCKYSQNIAGNTHISCRYPLLSYSESTKISMLSMINPVMFNDVLSKTFGFTGNMHGIQSGWFMFPENFDPSWIEGSCNYHSEIVGESVEFNIEFNKLILPLKNLLLDIKNQKKSEDEYIHIIKSFENVFSKFQGLDNLSAEERKIVLPQFFEELKFSYTLLQDHEKNI